MSPRMTIVQFLTARIADDEAAARRVHFGYRAEGVLAHELAECEAKRRIIALHESWPVLVEGPDEISVGHGLDGNMTARMTHKVAWLTTAAYRAAFGDEPPTSPVLAALATVYADHPHYDPEWAPA